MKSEACEKPIHKDVVIIGNGPSAIALSYMLAGNTPFVTSADHPDEYLSARLRSTVGTALVSADLTHLAQGLEGRTTNPISLLYDSLNRPLADLGNNDVESALIRWRKTENYIDHIVLGKGPPGGSWHAMDPQILTLSLAAWMALPDMPFPDTDTPSTSNRRASAAEVASYYEAYVRHMGLSAHFSNNVTVTNIEHYTANHHLSTTENQLAVPSRRCCKSRNSHMAANMHCLKWVQKVGCDEPKRGRICSALEKPIAITAYLSSLVRRRQKVKSTPEDEIELAVDDSDLIHEVYDFTADSGGGGAVTPPMLKRCKKTVCAYTNTADVCHNNADNKAVVPPKWLVRTYDRYSGRHLVFTCNSLVLANGAHDLPNRLELDEGLPDWVMHDLRSLEIELDLQKSEADDSGVAEELQDDKESDRDANPITVLIMGSGLSAADAVLAMRKRNVRVFHVFRNKSSDLIMRLPQNMYPEYHEIHQMMTQCTNDKQHSPDSPCDNNSAPYTSYPESTITTVTSTPSRKTVTIAHMRTGVLTTHSVDFACVLIGSRPDLGFLPEYFRLGTHKATPVDSKTNTVAIDRRTHTVPGFEQLYALGPLAGDKFARFLPGGALAAVADMYRQRGIVQLD